MNQAATERAALVARINRAIAEGLALLRTNEPGPVPKPEASRTERGND